MRRHAPLTLLVSAALVAAAGWLREQSGEGGTLFYFGGLILVSLAVVEFWRRNSSRPEE